ncbi:hypothetical protein [Vibrio crassostreae]|uniref:hypothetical protein n=1 Tax=Vibrio crassostreae TaxID=246167 RepID=UPI001B313E2B|nr:hypothetical protein [Vibrio crassostreae]
MMKNFLFLLTLIPVATFANFNDYLLVHNETVRESVYDAFSALGVKQCETPKIAVDRFLYIDVFCKKARISFPFERMNEAARALTSEQSKRDSKTLEPFVVIIGLDGEAPNP